MNRKASKNKKWVCSEETVNSRECMEWHLNCLFNLLFASYTGQYSCTWIHFDCISFKYITHISALEAFA